MNKKSYALWKVLKTSEDEEECIKYRDALPGTSVMRLFLKFDESEPSYTVYQTLIENSSKEKCIKYRDALPEEERKNIVIIEKIKDIRPEP